MSIWLKILQHYARHINIMKLQGRLRLWVCLASLYIFIMAIVHFFHIPLHSKTLHSHYDLTGDAIQKRRHEAVKKEADKIAKRAFNEAKVAMGDAEQVQILTVTFEKADEDGDGMIDLKELSKWIGAKIKEHLTLALRENFFMFTAVDQNPRNGRVSWEEYHVYFLKHQGFDDEYIHNHKENHKGMTREMKEAIMRDKAAWSEAARDNPEELSIDEFLAFKHPESSHATILSIVEETLSRLDVDGDGVLTEEEFSDPAMNEIPEYLTEEKFKEERIHEFRNVVDENKNNKVEKKELLMYIDPRNSHHAEKEAANLISLADEDQDGVLTLQEVLKHKETFINSKMIDAAKSFHDEF
ncbi:45 kDa calcium-binding protein-like [Oratosquilla oratoria]|uniref:45 kDa calcium-binding protein-like n=1 Tax=Oratosquilla oratoria TaxID=337810 RepID=UPI003F75868B